MMTKPIGEIEKEALQSLARWKPASHLLLSYLIENANDDGWVMISLEKLAHALTYNVSHISTSVKLLKAHHFLDVKKHGGRNVYRINCRILGIRDSKDRFSYSFEGQEEK